MNIFILSAIYAAISLYVMLALWRAPLYERMDEGERTFWNAIVKVPWRNW